MGKIKMSKHNSIEERERKSAVTKKLWQNPEYRLKQSIPKHNKVSKKLISDASKKRWSTKKYILKMKDIFNSDEYNKKNNRNKGKRLTVQQRKNKSENMMGRIVSQKTREKISKAHKLIWQDEDYRNRRKYNTGMKHSKKTKQILSNFTKNQFKDGVSEETKKKISVALKGKRKPKGFSEKLRRANLGKKHSEVTKKRISINLIGKTKGEKNGNWNGGSSYEPYGKLWTNLLKKTIRERERYVCFICRKKQDKSQRDFDVHHIDYNKKNNDPLNLITLCHSCHTGTNHKRKKWIKYFKDSNLKIQNG